MKRLMLVCVLGTFALPARAGSLEVLVAESGGPTIPVADNGALDTDPSVGVINVNTALLNPLLGNYVFTDLAAASNSPGASAGAFLVQQGTVLLAPGGGGSVTVLASDVDYALPAGPREMRSSASNTYTSATVGDSTVFRSWFNGSNGLGAEETPSPAVALVASPANPNSHGLDAAGTPVPLTSPYGLSNAVTITLAGGSGSARDAWAGSTVLTAVPEPASMALLLAAIPVLAAAAARRR